MGRVEPAGGRLHISLDLVHGPFCRRRSRERSGHPGIDNRI